MDRSATRNRLLADDRVFLGLTEEEARYLLGTLRDLVYEEQSIRIDARNRGDAATELECERELKRLRKLRNRITAIAERHGWQL